MNIEVDVKIKLSINFICLKKDKYAKYQTKNTHNKRGGMRSETTLNTLAVVQTLSLTFHTETFAIEVFHSSSWRSLPRIIRKLCTQG